MEFVKPYTLYGKGKPYINKGAINKKVEQVIESTNRIKGDNKLAWLLKALTCLDLTSLGGDDTKSCIEDLCTKAAQPVKLKFDWPYALHSAAVCVYPARVQEAVSAIKNLKKIDEIKIASVAAGFPSGQYPLKTRLQEIQMAISNGANEIDIVINREMAITHKWTELYEELVEMRKACYGVIMKTILAVGELNNFQDVYIASIIAMAAGSDFIKTSTGKEVVNATLPVGIVMCRAIRNYYAKTGIKVGFKPAGGIRTATDALSWLVLVKQELGNEWLDPKLFRIGASSVLDDIVKNIHSLW